VYIKSLKVKTLNYSVTMQTLHTTKQHHLVLSAVFPVSQSPPVLEQNLWA